MKETISVNLASQAFTFDKDAYRRLKEYLDAIRRRLPAGDPEILNDVEARLAEIFRSRISSPIIWDFRRERCGWRRCSWCWSAGCRFGSISCCGSSCPKVPNGSKGIPGRPSPARDCTGRGLRISDMRTGPGAET